MYGIADELINKLKDIKEKYQIMDELDKIDTPYKFDLVFVQNVENKEFLKSIYSEGVKI